MPLPIKNRVETVKKSFPSFWAKNRTMHDFQQERKSSGEHIYYQFIQQFLNEFCYKKEFTYNSKILMIENYIIAQEKLIEQIDLKKHHSIVARLQDTYQRNIQQANAAKKVITKFLNETILSHVHRY